MARQIIAIDGMTTEDCTFSVGIVHGGQWGQLRRQHRVPARRSCMAKRQADLDRGVERMLALSGTSNDVTVKVRAASPDRYGSRTPGTFGAITKRRAASRSRWASTSPTAAPAAASPTPIASPGAMGIPTLDGLGVRGADAHTLNEHIEVAA